jgi:phosphinothricin acetyltransferase
VRSATLEDLSAIVDIYNHAVATSTATFDLEPTTIGARREWFAQFGEEHPLLVAEVDGGVAGFAYTLPYRTRPGYRTTKECTIYIAPERQGRGIGSALYAEVIARAKSRGVHALIGVLGGDNPASVALHQKFGFTEVGRLREVGNKFGQWVDTPIFELLL